MAEEKDNVKVELEMPKDQVSVHTAGGSSDSDSLGEEDDDGSELKEPQDKIVETLKETRKELRQTKKEVEELKEKIDKSDEQNNDEDKSTLKQTTGYELGELVGAPLKPAEPEAKGKPKLSQLRVILLGFIVVAAGVILWPVFGFAIGLSVIITGSIFVAIGVLVRL